MANLTVEVDDETLKRVRIRALEQGTSVNALLRALLGDYTGIREQRREGRRGTLFEAHGGARSQLRSRQALLESR